MNSKNYPKANGLRNQKNKRKLQHVASKEGSNRQNGSMRLYHHLRDLTIIIRHLRTLGILNSNATGFLATGFISSSQVTSNSDWSNISQEFQRYRIKKIIFSLFPCYNVAAAASGANDYAIGIVMLNRWWDRSPNTVGNVTQAQVIKYCTTDRRHSFETNFLGFDDAQLWTATGTTISAEYSYGIGYSGSTSFTNFEGSSGIFNYVVDFEIEFEGPQ